MVTHTCNPSYSGLLWFEGSPVQKVCKNSISTNKKQGIVLHTCHHCYAGSINRRTEVRAGLGISDKTLFKKYLKQKRTGRVAQVTECLHSEYKALSSSSCTVPPKKNLKDSSNNCLSSSKQI
jgi:hypothetical protein